MEELTSVRYADSPLSIEGQCVATSAHDFEETIGRVSQAITDADLWLIHEINPQAQLRKGGFAIHPMRHFLFFHPRYMARLLAADPRAAIETPLKLTIMALPDGSVVMRYADPAIAFLRYAGLEDLGRELSGLCADVIAAVGAAAQPAIAAVTQKIVSTNPATGEILATFVAAGAEQIDKAVALARVGQAEWRAMTGAARGRIVRRVADILRARNDELAHIETLDTGKPISETSVVDVISAAECLEYYAGLAAGIAGEHIDLGPSAFGYTRREPLGIVAGIGAWNYPLQIACWKSAPALACGNAMIFKPSEQTPMTAVKLAEIMLEAGVPKGVFTVVQGAAETGRLLVGHPDIRKISLTGDVRTGKRVMAAGAETLKYVTLELGGKSPILVFDDANIDDAVSGAILGNFYSGGEICSNGTRVFVQRSVLDAFREKLIARVERIAIGDPLDPHTQIGSLISAAHMEKVLSAIARGQQEGARLLTGGHRVIDGALAKGCFVAPTIFEAQDDNVAIAREEIFGPVMTILPFHDEEEAIRRANATPYGLAAGVFTRDIVRAHKVIAQLEAGACWINHYNITPIELPFGGYKLSGLGRENGKAAIEHYTQLKSVYVNLGAVDSPY
ncbi:betaine-aldehyde dehydrogenase [Methylocapsa sp. S129]|uniref:betaine-aldehyde dehydrogenase n=1 Tax=Methylocapsa sp. S129 TaxID=1641869 RepID=UPI001AEE6FC1|nr:betaine-aldehyde dehydrogenase [Methylocapsa sp. S129]